MAALWVVVVASRAKTAVVVVVEVVAFVRVDSGDGGGDWWCIRKNTLSLERPRKYPKGCPNTT